MTLVELLVVVTIVGILGAFAVPAYIDYLTRSKIPEATSQLGEKRLKAEQFFQDNRTYVGFTECNYTGKYFNVSCTAAPTASAYTIQAVGTGSMAGFTYTINQANTKGTTIVAPAPSGWVMAAAATCWVTKKGGQC